MTESSQETVATTPVASKAKATKGKKVTVSAKSKKVATPRPHPPTSQMVNSAISSLKERGGSSLIAIKKYISSTYKLDAEKQAPFIKKYLKHAVAQELLIQTKGKGASGSFKLPPESKKTAAKKPKSETVKETAKPKRTAVAPKKQTPKKAVTAPKKAAAKKEPVSKTPAAKASKSAAPKKSPVKKASKVPAVKPAKSPKPKKVVAKSTKKATPKK